LSRTGHLIGNLEAAPLENGEVQAKTASRVYRSHLETDYQLLSGCREDLLRNVKGAWRAKRLHVRARSQRPARQEPQRLPLAVPLGLILIAPTAGAAGARMKGLTG
jgi:ring hydroxylating enzyme beta subunit